MAEEDTVADEDDGIMSEDAAEEMEGPQTPNATSKQLRHYYHRKQLENATIQSTQSRSTSVNNPLCYTNLQKAYKKYGIMVKKIAQTKRSLMPEFKVMVMD